MLHSLRKSRWHALRASRRSVPSVFRPAMLDGGQSGRVSGRLVVPLLFGGTLLLAGAVFLVGKMEKRRWDHVSLSSPNPGDRVLAEPESLRVYWGPLPMRWVQLTRIGDKQAVLTPCFSETPSLVWEWADTSVSARLRVLCPFCENADTLPVGSLQLPRLAGGLVSADLDMTLHFQNDTMPLKVFRRENPSFPGLKTPSLRWMRGKDTLWFIPQDSLALVETLSEADENPEGCQPDENEARPPEDKDFIESNGAGPSP